MKIKNIRTKHFQEYMCITHPDVAENLDKLVAKFDKAKMEDRAKIKVKFIELMKKHYKIKDYELFLNDEDSIGIVADGVGTIVGEVIDEQVILTNLTNGKGTIEERTKLIKTLIETLHYIVRKDLRINIAISNDDVDDTFSDILIECGFKSAFGGIIRDNEAKIDKCYIYIIESDETQDDEDIETKLIEKSEEIIRELLKEVLEKL